MNLDEWIKWGVDNNYLLFTNNKFKLTNNLNRNANNIILSSDGNNLLPTTKSNQELSTRSTSISIEDLYKQFQIDAQVPYRIPGSDGREFTVRTKSKAALNRFKTILSSSINYQGLVLATRFYYTHPKLFKKSLAKYIEEDIWESYYDEVMSKAEEGILDKYVKDIISPISKFGKTV